MEPHELPPLWALDMAAKAAGYAQGWWQVNQLPNNPLAGDVRASIIAHARTLAENPERYKPVDPAELKRWQDAREAAVAIVGYRWFETDKAATLRGESDCEAVIRAYKYFCHRDGVEPQDKAPGA